MELTKEQTNRQDIVDNACHNLICELSNGSYVEWDMEYISEVRDAVQGVLVDKLHIMSEMEFYPYIEDVKQDVECTINKSDHGQY